MVGLDHISIASDQPGNRDRFGRGEGEVVEDPAVKPMVGGPRQPWPLGQGLATGRVRFSQKKRGLLLSNPTIEGELHGASLPNH
jgi:hypothetical protein